MRKMKHAVIFGCGNVGQIAYEKLKNTYDIIAWCDNNSALWGTIKEKIRILSPEDMLCLSEKREFELFIANENMRVTSEILHQISTIKAENIYVWKRPFFYRANSMLPYSEGNPACYEKTEKGKRSVLFVSSVASIRDHKIARLVGKSGYKVYLAYLLLSPQIAYPEYDDIYEDIIGLNSMDQLLDFVNHSDFDIIHSSSEPEFLSALLSRSNKPVIHECHDLGSSTRFQMSPDAMMIEMIAHSFADGVIYPTDSLRKDAIKKFHIPKEKTYVIENFISRDLIPEVRLRKRSLTDKEIHAVYEGGIVSEPEENKKYLKDLWIKLADAGIHIHFYTAYDSKYCLFLESLHPRIHFEGNLSSQRLAVEMSQYDVGLCIFNINVMNRLYSEHASPNKLYEYLNAGLPVAVWKVEHYRDFVEGYGVGRELDFDGNLYQQMREIADIQVSDDFLETHSFMMEERIPGLIDFYCKCIRRHEGKCV